ncbi:MAG TPA: polysaccharide deacetylase family protein [Stellaceae bacterium]|nr:polysaccharide deacetylase family protein [Stellaceae bacterium]
MRHEPADAPLLVTTSWDDGHPSDLRVAALLEQHGIRGTFYIPSRNSEGRPVLRPAEITQLGRQFEIGGHTRNHVSLTELAPDLATDEILANKHWLEDVLGREVRGFAYVRGRHNRTVRRLVAQAGYQYARTVKNLTSTPGSDPFAVSTTTQFFAHPRSIYLRNYISCGPTLNRSAILAAVLRDPGLVTRLSRAAQACARWGGYFHLWGHSWELDQYDLWSELDCLLARLRRLNARFVTNAAWCEALSSGAAAPMRVAGRIAPEALHGAFSWNSPHQGPP